MSYELIKKRLCYKMQISCLSKQNRPYSLDMVVDERNCNTKSLTLIGWSNSRKKKEKKMYWSSEWPAFELDGLKKWGGA